ncbi:MAG: hypothetical protein ABIR91_01470 [Candidatus Saccharimonadales bacterium]
MSARLLKWSLTDEYPRREQFVMRNPKSNPINEPVPEAPSAPQRPAVSAIPDTAAHMSFMNGGSRTTSIDVNPATPAAGVNARQTYAKVIESLAVPVAAYLVAQSELTQTPGKAGREYTSYRMRTPGSDEYGPEETIHYWKLVNHKEVDDLGWTTRQQYILTEHGKIGCITKTDDGKSRLAHAVDLPRTHFVVLEQLFKCLAYIRPGETQHT